MRIVVDTQLCQGHAVCMGEAPEVFEVTREGRLTVLDPTPTASIRTQIEAAVRYCPTGALTLVEGDE
jgi:ferredoxin